MNGDDLGAIHNLTERVLQATARLSQVTPGHGPAEQKDTSEETESDVIDAEFEETDQHDRKAS